MLRHNSAFRYKCGIAGGRPEPKAHPHPFLPVPQTPQNTMSSLTMVPVFYLDQDSSWQQPHELVSRDRARRLKSTGVGVFIEHGRAFRLHQPSPLPSISLTPGQIETATTLTVSEIQANVGITPGDPGVPPNRELVRRAQFKVRLYPRIFDNLAVLAHGSRFQPVQVNA